jgi:hypothetical protein
MTAFAYSHCCMNPHSEILPEKLLKSSLHGPM